MGKKPPSEDRRVSRTKEIVLTAALEILISEGHEGVTPLAISEKTGVARTTVYRHWPTKHDILFDCMSFKTPVLEVYDTGDIRSDLIQQLSHLRIMLERSPISPIFGTLIERTERDPDFALMHAEYERRGTERLLDVLKNAVSRGELRPDVDVATAAASLGGPLFYLRLMARQPITDDFIAETVDRFLAH